ncbi:MAG: LCP family protein [Lachnospiraceae bacterium]|nr:LCP family protein [Lachnospiraceae bacterium]
MKDLFMTVLRLCLSASIVLAVVLLLRQLFSKLRAPKALSLCLWALVGLRLLIPAFPASSVSLVPQPVGSGQVVERVAQLTVEETRIVREEEPVYQEIIRRSPQIPVQRETAGQRYVVVSTKTLEAPKTVKTSILPVLTWIWLGGTVLMLGYMLYSFLKLRFKVRASIRQADNIYRCDELEAPFILGLIRPRIYLPSDLDPADEAYVLAHERAHLRRLDHIWKPLGFFLLSLYWFNPLFWLGYVLLCRDIEGACDEKVVKTETADYRKAYSLALVNCSMSRRLISACPLAFGETGVPGRIKSVLQYKKPAFRMLLAALLIGAITAGCALTNGKESTPGGGETAGTTEAQSTEPVSTEPSKQTESSSESPVTGNQEAYRTIVLFGVNTGDNRSMLQGVQGDTCVIISIERKGGEIKMASLPRDYLLKHAPGEYCKLTDAYARYGAEQVMADLNRNLDLQITDYIVLNWTAVADVVDMLGGIDLLVSKEETLAMQHTIYETMQATGRNTTQAIDNVPFHDLDGVQAVAYAHLNGVQAVAYARIRNFEDIKDFASYEHQSRLCGNIWYGMKELVKKSRTDKVQEIVEKASVNIKSNMDMAEILSFCLNATQYNSMCHIPFPYERRAIDAGVLSAALAGEVETLHRYLYPWKLYEPSDEIWRLDALHKEFIKANSDEEENTSAGSPEPIIADNAEKVLVVNNSYDPGEEGELAIHKHVSGNSGPKDFAVIEQNDILILDISGQSMKRYVNGEYQRTYVFQEYDGHSFERIETDGRYAYIRGWNKLLLVDLETGKEEAFAFPVLDDMGGSFAGGSTSWIDGSLVVQTERFGNYLFDRESGEFKPTDLGLRRQWKDSQNIFTYEGNTWVVDAVNRANGDIAVDAGGNLILDYFCYDSETVESDIYKLDPQGREWHWAHVDMHNVLTVTPYCIKMQRDGSVYVMCVFEPFTAIYVLPEGEPCIIAEPDLPVPEPAPVPPGA